MRSDESHYPLAFRVVVTLDHFGNVPMYRGCVMLADTMVFYMAAPAGDRTEDRETFANEVKNQFGLHLARLIESSLPPLELS